ncbi:hypothetical protein HKX48_006711, partial [Thoreauomyces humboldtii]
ANKLARTLRALGVGPEVIVPVCMRRSVHMVVAVLAVLKAGGAYIPLDVDTPHARNLHIISAAKATLLITTQHDASEVQDYGVQVVVADSDPFDLGDETNLDVRDVGVSDTNLAYIIFTSGSTGNPKGAMIEHRNIVAASRGFTDRYAHGPADRRLNFAQFTFDDCVMDFFATLTTGGTLCMAPKSEYNIASVIRRMSITFLATTPSVLALLHPDDCPSMRAMDVGGEPMLPQVVARWADKIHLGNAYGPTETCCLSHSHRHAVDEKEIHLIGYPFYTAKTLILDDRLRPVPIGCAGEICIAGPQVGRGYFGQPELTEKTYLIHPELGVKIYRSGDQGRYHHDGRVICMGRMDNQVKLFGLRIELGEIESVIQRVPAVKYVSAMKTTVPGEKFPRIVCFLSLEQEAASDNADLQDTELVAVMPTTARVAEHIDQAKKICTKHLPYYMVPTRWIPLNRLPFNKNGKIDAKTLRASTHLLKARKGASATADATDAKPVEVFTPAEHRVRDVIRSLCGKKVQLDDSIAGLGFTTVVRVRFLIGLRAAFDRPELTLTDIWNHPTIALLAPFLEGTVPVAETVALKMPAQSQPDTEAVLRTILLRVLDKTISDLEPGQSFSEMGLNSINKIMFVSTARKELDCPALKFVDLLDNSTLETLAIFVDAKKKASTEMVVAPQNSVEEAAAGITGFVPVTVDSFSEMGLNSINKIMFVSTARKELDCPALKFVDLLDNSTLETLAIFVDAKKKASTEMVVAPQNSVEEAAAGITGFVPVTVDVAQSQRDTEAVLRTILLEVLDKAISDLEPDQSFSEMGLNSISKIMFVSTARKELDCPALRFVDLLDNPTLETLAVFVDVKKKAPMQTAVAPQKSAKKAAAGITALPKSQSANFKAPSVPLGETVSTESIVREILEKVLPKGLIVNPEATFTNLGLGSIGMVRFVSFLRKKFAAPSLRGVDVYNHPTVVQLAAFLDERHPRATMVVPAARSVDGPSALTTERKESPMSASQKRFWLAQNTFDDTSYQVLHVRRVAGAFEPRTLEKAIHTVTRRHEILRTTYDLDTDRGLLQVVHRELPVPFAVVDLTNSRDPDAEVAAAVRADFRSSFELSTDAPVRVIVFKVGLQAHVVYIVCHHIAVDEWSHAMFMGELSETYLTLVAGRRPDDNLSAIQYSDFTAWHAATLESERQSQLAYWSENLRDCEPLQLPATAFQSAEQLTGLGFLQMELDRKITDAFMKLCADFSVTQAVGYLALFNMMMIEQSGSYDFAVSMATTHRGDMDDSLDVMGCCINSVILRCCATASDGFTELITKAQQTMQNALRQNDVPFEDVVHHVFGDSSLDILKKLQTAFTMVTEGGKSEQKQLLWGPEFPINFEGGDPQGDLDFFLIDSDGEFRVRICYNRAVYGPELVRSLAVRFGELARIVTINRNARPGLKGASAASRSSQPEVSVRCPATSNQLRMWASQRISRDGSYNLPYLTILDFAIDPARMQSAVDRLMQRHEILRTTYALDPKTKQLMQVVACDFSVLCAVHDVSGHVEPKAEVLRRCIEDNSKPFDLARDIIRFGVYRLSDKSSALYINVHHIAFDEYSLNMMYAQIAELYEDPAQPARIDGLAQYAEVCARRHDLLHGDGGREHALQRSFWSDYLLNARALALPRDAVGTCASSSATTENFEVPPAVLAAFEKAVRSERCSTFSAFLAVFETLMYRATGQADFTVLVPVSNRGDVDGSESAFGCMTNTATVRSIIDPDRTFRSRLQDANHNMDTVLRHADIPFEEVLRIHTDPSNADQDGIMFSYMCEEGTDSVSTWPFAKTEELPFPQDCKPAFGMLFSVQKVADAALISIEFDRSLFSLALMTSMAADYVELIASVTCDIAQTLRPAPAVDVRTTIDVRPATKTTSTHESKTVKPIQKHSDSTLTSVNLGSLDTALKSGSRELVNSAIDASAAQVARCLVASGVTPGEGVPIVATSLELCVGMLGIVMAHASAVVVGHGNSPELTRSQLETFAARVVLTTRDGLPLLPDCKTVVMETGAPVFIPSPPPSLASSKDDNSTATVADRVVTPEPLASSDPESDAETWDDEPTSPVVVSPEATDASFSRSAASWRQNVLRQVWSGVLSVPAETITPSSSFFELGGHSLIAIIMCEDLTGSGYRLNYLDVFKNPKLADMAECMELPDSEFEEMEQEQEQRQIKAVEPFSILGIDRTRAKAAYGSELADLELDFDDVEDIYQASPLQSGLVALSAQGGQYLATFAYRLIGVVEPEKMRMAFSQVVDRNSILRTSFFYPESGDGLMQVVRLPTATKLQWTQVAVPRSRFEQSVSAAQAAEQAKSVKLGDQYMRCALVTTTDGRATERETVLLLTIHHALFDFPSLTMYLQDVFQAYVGKEPTPREPFAKFIRHINSRDQGLVFYERYLAHAVPTVFPVRTAISSTAEPKPKAVEITVPVDLSRFTRTHSILPGTFLKACWGLVLMLHANSEDVLFGFVTSGREMEIADTAAHNIAGPTINTIITRIQQAAGGTKALDFLRAIQSEGLEQLEYSHTGLRDIKSAMKSAPEVALFNTLVNFSGLESTALESPWDLPFVVKSEEGAMNVNYPIIVEVDAQADKLRVTLGFDSQVVAEDEVAQVATNFTSALKNLAAISETTLMKDVSLVSASTLPVPVTAADPGPAPQFNFLHQAFEDQAKRNPDRVALHLEDSSTISYGEMDARANKLARKLRQAGIGRQDIVPLCIDKSGEMVIAIFAVLKAGAGYVPLDPHSPAARHQIAIDKTDARLVITKSDHRELFASCRSVTVVYIDEDWGQEMLSGKPLPSFQRGEDDVAYVIMTSGTTGQPKGCVIGHRAAVHAMAALSQASALNITSASRVLQFANYTFDASISDFFITLGVGARLCLAGRETLLYDLPLAIQAFEANWVMLTPSVAALLNPEEVPTIKTLILVGEPIRADVVTRWLGKARMANGYGPSEAAEICVMQEVREADAQRSIIGRPIGATKLWILSENMGLVPAGGAGELYLESVQLARGYLKDPVLTSRAFIAHPFKQGARLYRTGDMVRLLANGQIECLGRKDSQIKLHGLRIELAEIEYAIQREPSVARVCVILWQEQLVAWIVPRDQAASGLTTAPEILFEPVTKLQKVIKAARNRIQKHLAPYMMPHRWIPVSKIPLSPSGKTDHRHLISLLEATTASSLMSLVATEAKSTPQTANESLVASWWAEVLAIPLETIGREDSFFTLGGDSVSLIRLSQMARRSGLQFDIAQTYETPQLREFSLLLRAVGAHKNAEKVEPFSLIAYEDLDQASVLHVLEMEYGMSLKDVEDVYPATELQTGMIAQTLRTPGAYMLQAPSTFKHAGLRTTFVYVANRSGVPVPLQVVKRTSTINWNNQHCSPTTLTACLAAAEAETLVKLGDEFMNFTLIRVGADHYKFIWKIHHALMDAWFMGQLMDDLATAYRGDVLTDRPLYNVYIRYLQQQDREEAVAYFEQTLSGVQTTAYPRRDPATAHKAADARSELVLDVTANFDGFTKQHGITIANLFRACWAIVLSHHADTNDVLFGCLNSGREIEVDGVSEMIGLCIHTVPVRVAVDKEANLLSFIREEQRSFSKTIRHGLLGLRAIRKLLPAMQGSLFDTVVNYRGSLQSEADRAHFPFEITGETSRNAQNYPLVIDVDILNNRMSVTACYDETIIGESEVAILLRHVSAAVISAIDNPTVTIGQVSLCDEEEVKTLKMGARCEEMLYEPELGLHELFQQQVARTPDAVAVMWDNGTLTYRELDERANVLAANLQSFGCALESKIALYLRKSEFLPVSILAVLKAGGCYVPLDPANPPNRNETILTDINASLGLTTSNLLPSLAAGEVGRKWIVVDKLDLTPSGPNLPPRVPGWNSRCLAYIMFSSGTTGTPKGIALDHRAVVNGMMGVRDYMRESDGQQARVLQYSNYCFDVSGVDIWCSLTAGSILVIPDPTIMLDDLAGTIRKFGITHAALTPTVARLISPDQTPSLLGLVVGGESVPQQLFNVWADHVRLVEGWGPTETAIFCTARLISPKDRNPAVLGKPYGATVGYVLDAEQQLVPTGGLGEVYLSGPQLARGYINAPELTASAFVPNPFTTGGEPWDLMYRTGDMCRLSSDGALEFVRRKDTQTKINGLRIELGEIEAVIGQTDEVKAVMVDVLETNSVRGLAAWLTPYDQDAPIEDIVQKMQSTAAQVLPPYMVPRQWFVLDALPLNKNGKADRRAVLDLTARGKCRAAGLAASDAGFIDISTDEERVMQQAWADVLRLPAETIGRTHHFVQLGGDSVSVIMLVQSCRAAGYLLTVPLALQFPVLTDMAAQLIANAAADLHERPTEKPTCLETVQEVADPAADTLFLVHAVEGLALPFFALRGHVSGNIIAINSPEFYSAAAEKQPTVSDMADFYCKRILERQPIGPYRIGGYSFGGLVALEIAHRLRSRRQKVALVVLIDSVNHEFGDDEVTSVAQVAEQVDAVIGNTIKERTIPDYMLRSLRAEIAHNLTLMGTHASQSTSEPVVLLRASETSSLGEDKGARNGWDSTLTNLTMIDVPGHHWSIFTPEHAPALGKALQSAIDASYLSRTLSDTVDRNS